MQAVATTQTVNEIGQITLGRHFAGQQVTVEPVGEGIWHIHTAAASRPNQEWFNNAEARQRFDEAMGWANEHPASAENSDTILAKLAADCK